MENGDLCGDPLEGKSRKKKMILKAAMKWGLCLNNSSKQVNPCIEKALEHHL